MNLGRFGTGPNRNRAGPVWPDWFPQVRWTLAGRALTTTSSACPKGERHGGGFLRATIRSLLLPLFSFSFLVFSFLGRSRVVLGERGATGAAAARCHGGGGEAWWVARRGPVAGRPSASISSNFFLFSYFFVFLLNFFVQVFLYWMWKFFSSFFSIYFIKFSVLIFFRHFFFYIFKVFTWNFFVSPNFSLKFFSPSKIILQNFFWIFLTENDKNVAKMENRRTVGRSTVGWKSMKEFFFERPKLVKM